MTQGEGSRRPGRPRAASSADVAAVALRLFAERGFDAVTMSDVAEVAGIGRTTLLRYFPSKMAVLWSRSEEEESALVAQLAARPAGEHPLDALCTVIPRMFHYADDDLDLLATQVRLIAEASAGNPLASERFASLRTVIGEFIAARSQQDARYVALLTESVLSAGWIALTAWTGSSDTRPDGSLTTTFEHLRTGFR